MFYVVVWEDICTDRHIGDGEVYEILLDSPRDSQLDSNPNRQLDISYRILLYNSALPVTYAPYSTFSPFSSLTLSSAYSCIYAIAVSSVALVYNPN